MLAPQPRADPAPEWMTEPTFAPALTSLSTTELDASKGVSIRILREHRGKWGGAEGPVLGPFWSLPSRGWVALGLCGHCRPGHVICGLGVITPTLALP